MEKKSSSEGLLQRGIIYAAISFVTSMGHMGFQAIMGHHLKDPGQFGSANSALGGLMILLGLLPSVAIFAVTHYIAHYHTSGDRARLQGLLLGCRKFLFRLTLAGSVLAIALAQPLSHFFHYSPRLTLVSLGCALLGLWVGLATALCQGLNWFKRLALIGFLAMLLRLSFGWFITFQWPSAETAVLATGFASLAYLTLLFWRKELAMTGTPVSPWNRELAHYLAISAAYVIGNFCFLQGDLLVAKKFFEEGRPLDAFTAAGMLARALPMAVTPLLLVLFTSRSGRRTGNLVGEQFKLMGLSGLALVFGAVCLFLLRSFCLKILNRDTPEAAGMIGLFATTMVFVGLLQTLALWSLASRWFKVTLFYGGLGVAYWLVIFVAGKAPERLLPTMATASGIAFALMLCGWWATIRRHPESGESAKAA